MGQSIETRVSHAVSSWLRWLPRWHPSTSATGRRLCRRCFGSPVAAAAGFDHDVPHAVQHALLTRLKRIVDEVVDDYTERNLPLLSHELHEAERRRSARSYRPNEGLDPEFDGLDVDPEPNPDHPFLFTLAELSSVTASEAPLDEPPELSDEAKAALRTEVALADDCANKAGVAVCAELVVHRERIARAIAEYVEPQIAALLAELSEALDAPPAPHGH